MVVVLLRVLRKGHRPLMTLGLRRRVAGDGRPRGLGLDRDRERGRRVLTHVEDGTRLREERQVDVASDGSHCDPSSKL